MSLIKITNLTFAYEGSYDYIFENASFQIDTNWKLGFVGRNGRGKTTFLNLLLGKYRYSGSITASVDFEYFPFTVPDKTWSTQTVLESISDIREEWELKRELSLLEVAEEVLYRPFGTLSNGERTKVLLAALFLKENSFLLIDEPTNHLDLHGRAVVSRYLRSKQGFILVSHDRVFLDNAIDHILSINKENIEVQRGNFSTWWGNKQKHDHYELAEHAKLKKDIKRLSAAAKRTSNWSDHVEKTKLGSKNSGIKADKGYIGHKSAKMMKRAKVMERRQQVSIDEKANLLKNLDTADALKISPLPYHKSRLITLDGISLYYGDKAVLKNLSITIEQGERVVLWGKNGSGKSSLLKFILGEEIAATGRFHIGSKLIISYLPQDTRFIKGCLRDFICLHGLDESLFKAILRKMDFAKVQFTKDMADFSDGQKKKVLIAKSLCEKAHLYLWDEPLNYIDILSRMQLEDLLHQFKPTILFVEHDAAFCSGIATKKVLLD